MKCPNADKDADCDELVRFVSHVKDHVFFNYDDDRELFLDRLVVYACPACGFVDPKLIDL